MSERYVPSSREVRLRGSSIHLGECSVELGDVAVHLSPRGMLIVSAAQFSDAALMRLVEEWSSYEGGSSDDRGADTPAVTPLVMSAYTAAAAAATAVPRAVTPLVMSAYTAAAAAATAVPRAVVPLVMSAYTAAAAPRAVVPLVMSAYTAAAGAFEPANAGQFGLDELFAAARCSPLSRSPLLAVSVVGVAPDERPCAVVVNRGAKLNIRSNAALQIVAEPFGTAFPWKIVSNAI